MIINSLYTQNDELNSSAHYLKKLEAAEEKMREYRALYKEVNEALRMLRLTEKEIKYVNDSLDLLIENIQEGAPIGMQKEGKVIKSISTKIESLNDEKEKSISFDINLKVVEERLEFESERYRVLLYKEESNVETLRNNYNDALQREQIEEFNRQ